MFELSYLRAIQDEIKNLQEEVNWHVEQIVKGEQSKKVYPTLVAKLRELERKRDEIINKIIAEGETDNNSRVIDIKKGVKQ